MKIDADVAAVAKHFGLDAKMIQAVVNAEGDILKAVRCSLPATKDRAAALDITCRSAVHAMSDFLTNADSGDLAEGFVDFWAKRWAPQGATNDPTGLNANWPRNVLRLWMKR